MTSISSSWSRRRAAVTAETEAEEAAAQNAIFKVEHAALAEQSEEEILSELGLPDPDTLVRGDDFTAFMAKAVPAYLRKRALRKLWLSSPVLACVDGLNDYDDDYLTGSTGQGAVKTSYQIGKGMLAHLQAIERQRDALKNSSVSEDQEVLLADDVGDETDNSDVVSDQYVATVPLDDCNVDDQITYGPRRMQFKFEDDTA